MILVSGSLGADADFVDKMLVRVMLIMLATLYVAGALTVINRYLFPAKE